MSRLTIIVAATKSNGIGHNSRLPWRLPKEMKYFTQVTSNSPQGHCNAVFMGRNTWESIPEKQRPLIHRANIVISHNKNYKLYPSPDTTPSYLHTSFAAALGQLNNTDPKNIPIHRAFIIGGASLYSEGLALSTTMSPSVVDRILLTRIISPDFECDVFMPNFLEDDGGAEKQSWKKAEHEALEGWVGFEVPRGVQEENGIKYEFQMWTRDL